MFLTASFELGYCSVGNSFSFTQHRSCSRHIFFFYMFSSFDYLYWSCGPNPQCRHILLFTFISTCNFIEVCWRHVTTTITTLIAKNHHTNICTQLPYTIHLCFAIANHVNLFKCPRYIQTIVPFNYFDHYIISFIQLKKLLLVNRVHTICNALD